MSSGAFLKPTSSIRVGVWSRCFTNVVRGTCPKFPFLSRASAREAVRLFGSTRFVTELSEKDGTGRGFQEPDSNVGHTLKPWRVNGDKSRFKSD
jgi:hypothetical protein